MPSELREVGRTRGIDGPSCARSRVREAAHPDPRVHRCSLDSPSKRAFAPNGPLPFDDPGRRRIRRRLGRFDRSRWSVLQRKHKLGMLPMIPESFHRATRQWFLRHFRAPTLPQARGWSSITPGDDTLVAAPTGSGKTLAAFLAAIDALIREGLQGSLPDETRVLYVSPLRALSNDIERNLQAPLQGIADELVELGLPRVELRTAVRTGDTPPSSRAKVAKKPPHILVTTPESLYILLTSESGQRMLATVRTVIVDEIHALVGDKRGAHLALSLERLEHLRHSRGGATERAQRIGLSATQRPIEKVGEFLVGRGRNRPGAPRPCAIVDEGHARRLDLGLELGATPLETVMSKEAWEEVFDRLVELIEAHATPLVFVNTRRLAERVARALADRIGERQVTAHHGSLARAQRLGVEERLKSGELRAVVATASLELGIDVGAVELVCQLGSPRSISTFLQRVGRSGHSVGGTPRGRLFPLSRDELVECAALLDAVRRGELDTLQIPAHPIDILAQQIVATCARETWDEDALFSLVTGAYSYRDLPRHRFDQVLEVLCEGFAAGRGRSKAYLHRDGVGRRVRGRRGTGITAMTSGGAIPDLADYDVVLEPEGTVIGSLNEDFAIESMAGDVFQLGNASWRILGVTRGKVRVEDARGAPPTIPFWLGEAPGRTRELSAAVVRLRRAIDERIDDDGDASEALAWARDALGLSEAAAEQLVGFLAASRLVLGTMPTDDTLVAERFYDDAGGMQLVLHAPFGMRINRAWGLALRKRFCQRFNFELQAAANDDAIVLSLGPVHSFPLEDVFGYLRSASVRELLVQALLVAPMFTARWRWNASRALAVPRFSGGRRVPPQIQRMRADDLLTLAFPDQVACAENLTGPRQVPDHPLVAQTIDDCLCEAMDLEGLLQVLERLERGELEVVARDLPHPSPLASSILAARPWAFLDDAPLEERRANAVAVRRFLEPAVAAEMAALDHDAIVRVRKEAWPRADDVEELHDALMIVGAMTEAELQDGRTRDGRPWATLADALHRRGRAAPIAARGRRLWVAAEREQELRVALFGGDEASFREPPLQSMVRSRLEVSGPVTVAELGATLGVEPARIDGALQGLEAEGYVLRGRFSTTVPVEQWCERALLARIHRCTLERLRAEIAPVHLGDYLRFLCRWQHVDPETRVEGPHGTLAVLEQLEGYELAAGSWESEILPARIERYDPAWLDAHCLSGRVTWVRLGRPNDGRAPAGPLRSTPIAFVDRRTLAMWTTRADLELSADARRVLAHLRERGAVFADDLAIALGLEPFRIDDALAELVAAGAVTGDGFGGLRSMCRTWRAAPEDSGSFAAVASGASGRWSAVVPVEDAPDETRREHAARVLLRRWGVVVRRLLERERNMPPWYALLPVFRRLEARGEVRGGRFVEGCAGEQYALPEAVAMLRDVRRTAPTRAVLVVSAADPLNLVGILGTGERVPAVSGTRVLYCDGAAIGIERNGEVTWLKDVEASVAARTEAVLQGRPWDRTSRARPVRRPTRTTRTRARWLR